MRFIEALSYSGADYLMKQKGENHEKRRVYFYGFQIVIGAIIKFLILFVFAFATDTILPSFLITIVFATLRILAGGYHMNTYGRCLAVSISMFIVFSIIARYTYHYWTNTQIVIFTVLIITGSLFCLNKWAPSDNPNRPITELDEIKKFKRLSIICLSIWTLVVTILFLFNSYMLLLSILFGLFLEIFSITPVGHTFFDVIRRGFNKVKK